MCLGNHRVDYDGKFGDTAACNPIHSILYLILGENPIALVYTKNLSYNNMVGEPYHDIQHSRPHISQSSLNNQSLNRVLDFSNLIVEFGCLIGTVSTFCNH